SINPADTPWYATDDNLYFSGRGPGITVLPLAGGPTYPLPGFEQMHLAFFGSPWAIRVDREPTPTEYPISVSNCFTPSLHWYFSTRELGNVVTRQRIPVTVRPDSAAPAASAASAASVAETGLICVPAFCAGVSRGRVTYLVRPDGSGRATMPSWSAG